MNEIALGLQSIVSAHITESRATKEDNAIHEISGPAGAAVLATDTGTPPLADMAVMDLAAGTLIFLNNTSPSYILVNYTNASVIIWTSPANASDTVPGTHIAKLVSKIGVWLPYFEALGILTLVYKVGKLIYDGVQWHRGRGGAAQGVRRDAMRPIIV
jgi:hypothetical protein